MRELLDGRATAAPACPALRRDPSFVALLAREIPVEIVEHGGAALQALIVVVVHAARSTSGASGGCFARTRQAARGAKRQ